MKNCRFFGDDDDDDDDDGVRVIMMMIRFNYNNVESIHSVLLKDDTSLSNHFFVTQFFRLGHFVNISNFSTEAHTTNFAVWPVPYACATISPGQWQPWTAVSSALGLTSMVKLQATEWSHLRSSTPSFFPVYFIAKALDKIHHQLPATCSSR